MLTIRLQRIGKKNRPAFRVVLQERSWAPQGKAKELLGFYDPVKKEKKFQNERVKYWIAKGAEPSPTVHNLFVDAGLVTGSKVKTWSPKKKKEEKPAAAQASESKDATAAAEKAPTEAAPEQEKPAESSQEEPAQEKPAEEAKEEAEAAPAPADEKPAEEPPAPAAEEKTEEQKSE
jgi:small subunit ribosomal protein S16